MIYIFTSIFYLITDKRKNSISKVLFFILLLSSISSYLVGRQPSLTFDVSIYVTFNAILLYILFYSFKQYSNAKYFNDFNIVKKRLISIEKIIVFISSFTIIINIFIFYNVFSLLLLETISVDEYKNEGGAEILFSSLVPSSLITLSNLFSPIGYISLSMHFYYLINKKIGRTILHFILSSLIILSGLLALSRSSTTLYVLVYLTILIFIYPLIDKKIKRKILLISAIFFTSVGSVFIIISQTRFSERYTKNSLNNAVIDNEKNPFVFSVLDYFSQWEENGPIIMKKHKPGDNFWGLYNSSGIAVHVQKILYGANNVNRIRENQIYKLMGDQASKFHGNIARLVYDFGFFGTFLFIIFYSYIIKYLRPRNGIVNFKTLLFLPVLLPFCVVFFTGNVLSSLSLNIAIIYVLGTYIYIKY